MGRHDFICPQCKHKFETLRLEGNTCPMCGFEKPEWQPSCQIPTFKAFWHPHLGHDPVFIDSAKTLDKELAKIECHIPMEKKGRKPYVRLPETEKEARNA